ncbi:MAG: lamin tail domain-containing protein [Ginsengibacter sp.]
MSKKFLYSFGILLLISGAANAQFFEDFSDENFKKNQRWIGDTSDFKVNASKHLQSTNTIENSTFYLSHENKLCNTAEWQFWLQINFNPSSSNYVDVYLAASSADLKAVSTVGYFVRIGNSDDEISLYRKDANGKNIKIIDGENGILNHSSNVMKVKVIRDESNQWLLYRDMTGSGNSFINEGTVTDSTYTNSNFFGFLVKQSTSSFFQKHFFDDIEIKNYVPDKTAPEIVSVTAVSSTTLDILFNEPLEKSSNIFSNYSANNALGMPTYVTLDAQNPALVHLTFENLFTNGYAYTLTVNGVKDLDGNKTENAKASFSFYIPQQYDIVIDEIFADPSPPVGLPNYEWIEIKNTSAFPINLKGWKISDLTSTSGPIREFILAPDSFLIICSSTALNALSGFGKTVSITNFPSLDNEGDLISIADANGKIIHAVQYSAEWYQNDLKKDGGWSLEMIDTKNPCSGISNWKSSKDIIGGTPGRKNSVDGINNDSDAPKIVNAFANGSTSVTIVFNEPLDSFRAASKSNYNFDNGLKATSAFAIGPLFNRVNITLNQPISEGIVYTVNAKNITDCSGNSIGGNHSAKFGIAQNSDSFDLVINEILFNPLPSGVDYVELFNRSNKIIDLNKIYLANRNTSNTISSITQLSTEPFLFFPKDFILITTNPEIVKSQYITTNPEAFLKMKTMPAFSNDKGNVIVLNLHGTIIDEVNYTEKWHFPLLNNAKGVSLERIDYEGSSLQSNFHSAATSSGYGTPGFQNSQYKMNEDLPGEITITPEIFSPDNDGHEDFATINYHFPTAGFVANVTIFDASGRPVRFLQKNALSGIKGYYRWDGLDDKNRKLPQGIYIIYTEIFNKDGKKKQFKNTIVLARRNN